MNGEQLCYMHRFVHRSLFIEIQNGDIPKCPYLVRDIPKIIKFKATNSLRVSCLFCIFKHSPQKTV